jgi:hypothetical protein
MYLQSPCPPDYPLPFDTLITAAWVILAIVSIDLLVAAGSLIVSRSRGRAIMLLALLLGAPVALGLLFSLQRQNLALCLISGDIHYTPQYAATVRAYYAQLVAHAATQAYAAFLAIAAIAAIAFLGALTMLATLPGARRLRWPQRHTVAQ